MICRNCNTEVEDGALFCQNCGQRIEQTSPATQQSIPLNVQEQQTASPVYQAKVPAQQASAPVYHANVQPQQTFPQQSFTSAAPQPQPVGTVQAIKPNGSFVKARILRIWTNILLIYSLVTFVFYTVPYGRGAIRALLDLLTRGTFYMVPVIPRVLGIIENFIIPIAVPVLFWWRNSLYHKAKKQNIGYCPKCNRITSHNSFAICTDCKKDYFSHCLGSAFLSTLAAIARILASLTNGYDAEMSHYIFVIIFGALTLFTLILTPFINIYMYPSRMARKTGHAASGAIFWLNIFLGGTVIFWIILLIWASSGTGNIESKMNALQTAPSGSVADQFAELQKLKTMGAITDEEFEQKRQQILQRL